MMQYLTPDGIFGNPASRSHSFGQAAEKAVEEARAQVAALIGANPLEIVWTSGATESNNLAIKGAARCAKKNGCHIVTLTTEHKAVLDSMHELEQDGFDVTYLSPKLNGLIDLEKFVEVLRDDTVLVSVMWVNNEIGVIQPIKEIGKICRERGIVFHVDAAQAPGKVRMDVNAVNADLLSLCAHKVYGPKGIGALYVRRKPRVQLEAQIHGGGHERGLRSGTLATHQIAGMGEAFRLAELEFDEENRRARALHKKLLEGIFAIDDTSINGDLKNRVAQNVNVSFNFVDSDSLMMAMKDVAISSGSACTSASVEPSYVLCELGVDDESAHSSIRISIGRFTTQEEVDFLIALLQKSVNDLREISPSWTHHVKINNTPTHPDN